MKFCEVSSRQCFAEGQGVHTIMSFYHRIHFDLHFLKINWNSHRDLKYCQFGSSSGINSKHNRFYFLSFGFLFEITKFMNTLCSHRTNSWHFFSGFLSRLCSVCCCIDRKMFNTDTHTYPKGESKRRQNNFHGRKLDLMAFSFHRIN